jgi:hypothetical protein
MIALFLAATFGMMALLSVPLTVPPLDRIFAPPVVEAPAGPAAAGPGLAQPSWGHPQVAAAPALSGQALTSSATSVTGSGPGSSETPPPAVEPAPRLVMLRRLAGEIANSASPRLKALIRTGRITGRDVLRRTAIRLLHGHSQKDPQGSVGLGQIVTPPIGHGDTGHINVGHGHDQGRHHTEGRGHAGDRAVGHSTGHHDR